MKFKNWMIKFASLLPAFALTIGIASLSSACVAIYYQPEVPAALNQMRK